MQKEWFEFIGYMLGDGTIVYGSKNIFSRFCVFSGDARELKEKILEPLGIKSEEVKIKETASYFHINADLTEKLGWSNGKVVPKVEDFTDDQLACVIRGCFESDGGVEQRCRSWRPLVRFTNINFELVKFVCDGLERLGVKFSLTSWDPGVPRKRKYQVYVKKDLKNIEVFRQKIGFITERKSEMLLGLGV